MKINNPFKKKTALTCKDINIRDPFVICENGRYYMYGTRAFNFGRYTCGFDVYESDDLVFWSRPQECFNSNEVMENP